jgi:hypothetical protein
MLVSRHAVMNASQVPTSATPTSSGAMEDFDFLTPSLRAGAVPSSPDTEVIFSEAETPSPELPEPAVPAFPAFPPLSALPAVPPLPAFPAVSPLSASPAVPPLPAFPAFSPLSALPAASPLSAFPCEASSCDAAESSCVIGAACAVTLSASTFVGIASIASNKNTITFAGTPQNLPLPLFIVFSLKCSDCAVCCYLFPIPLKRVFFQYNFNVTIKLYFKISYLYYGTLAIMS